MKPLRIYTAIFRKWYPSYSWFGRDSGLVTVGLRSIGVDSRLVILDTPGLPQEDRFLPATREQFLDPVFWKSLKLDAVVLQGGGEAAVQGVADAIRASGTKLAFRMDTDGIADPLVDLWLFFYAKWWGMGNPVRARYIYWEEMGWKRDNSRGREVGDPPSSLNSSLSREIFQLFVRLVMRPIECPMVTILKLCLPRRFGPFRIAHRLAKADVVLVESKIAVARIQRLLLQTGHREIAKRVVDLPIPIPETPLHEVSHSRENIVITAARLEDDQKDLKTWVRVVGKFLNARPEYRAVVIGNGSRYVEYLVRKYVSQESNRFTIIGRCPPDEIRRWELKSKIFLTTSRGEGFPNAIAEALCRGCSVAGPDVIAALSFACSHSSGTISKCRGINDLLDALVAEANEWDAGRRDPIKISNFFSARLSPRPHAQKLLEILSFVRR